VHTVIVLCCWTARAQNEPNLAAILERLERLDSKIERSPKRLQTSATLGRAPKLEERLEVQERRTEELADTKVQASHACRSPYRDVAIHAFSNGRFNGASENPPSVFESRFPRTAGATCGRL
jgi:hypothetical protein